MSVVVHERLESPRLVIPGLSHGGDATNECFLLPMAAGESLPRARAGLSCQLLEGNGLLSSCPSFFLEASGWATLHGRDGESRAGTRYRIPVCLVCTAPLQPPHLSLQIIQQSSASSVCADPTLPFGLAMIRTVSIRCECWGPLATGKSLCRETFSTKSYVNIFFKDIVGP